jgi:hypothetical protein
MTTRNGAATFLIHLYIRDPNAFRVRAHLPGAGMEIQLHILTNNSEVEMAESVDVHKGGP